MALKLVSSSSLTSARFPFLGSASAVAPASHFRSSTSSAALPLLLPVLQRGSSYAITASKEKQPDSLSLAAAAPAAFQPFQELKRKDLAVPVAPGHSLAKQFYSDECELAVNEQINVEYNVSYIYHAMYAYFERDNVALKGLAKFFKESSLEEREHAEKLIEYQNKRGGKVKLHPVMPPIAEFDHAEKGDALNAMELALALEKLTNEKLLNLHNVAKRCNDTQMEDFIESEFLTDQIAAIKKISEYVSQLRRIGKGHGVWDFDQMLLHEGGPA
ncbi:ferritin-4, chloroplastic-like [Punica granatum]|uniref:Ferritin n=1 Tax=Punica granatum TaxID=22663 RepID=A0A6P8C848_PUNGR|nr:ferritin-4, chloroplastic-like [Punica granatum]